jgi:hypothetical protein
MRLSIVSGGIMALLSGVALQTATGDTLIFVNCGSHRSADVTGHQEANVNWLDDDRTDDTHCTESFAALELQHYLQKLTGRFDDFDTVKDTHRLTKDDLIVVGGPRSNAVLRVHSGELGLNLNKLGFTDKQLAELGPAGYRIKSVIVDGRRITLVAGGDRVGTLYGAYNLLYRLGCRWYTPGEDHVEIPSIEKISDLTITERLPIAARPCPKQEASFRAGADFFIWMARNRFNSWSGAEENLGLLHKLGIESQTSLSRLNR